MQLQNNNCDTIICCAAHAFFSFIGSKTIPIHILLDEEKTKYSYIPKEYESYRNGETMGNFDKDKVTEICQNKHYVITNEERLAASNTLNIKEYKEKYHHITDITL